MEIDIHSMCRICLESFDKEGNSYNLFTVPGLAHMLCTCTTLNVDPQDGFPSNICGICYGRLNDMANFHKLCADSVQKFKEYMLDTHNRQYLNGALKTKNLTSATTKVTETSAMTTTTATEATQLKQYEMIPTTTIILMDSLQCIETPTNIEVLEEKMPQELQNRPNQIQTDHEFHDENRSHPHHLDNIDDDDDDDNGDERRNFDPLLMPNLKMELINNQEDVFKMLENVDKDIRADENNHLHVMYNGNHRNNHCNRYFTDEHNGEDKDFVNETDDNDDSLDNNNLWCKKSKNIANSKPSYERHSRKGYKNNTKKIEFIDNNNDADDDYECRNDREENNEKEEYYINEEENHKKGKQKRSPLKQKVFSSLASNGESDDDEEDNKPLVRRLRESLLRGKDYDSDEDDDDDDDDSCDNENEGETLSDQGSRYKTPTKSNHNKNNILKNNNGNIPKKYKGNKIEKKRKRIPAAERYLHRIIECHICHQKFKKTRNYEEHMKHHNDKLPFQCEVENCKRGFTTAYGLRLHVEHCHSETVEKIPCTVEGCNQIFTRRRTLNWHLKRVHKISKEDVPKNYPCTECDKIFKCPMALKKHMYKHDGKELPFPCNICGKRFVINSALKDHLMRHAGIKNYVCPYCGVGKTTRQEWNTHIATHSREKKFKCHLCPHASHNKNNLRMHIRVVHEKIKDYACQYCGKTFGKSNACKMHEMTHTGEKRCECKVCGKRFLYPKGLTKHLKTHEKRVLRAIEIYRKRQAEAGDISAEQAADLPSLPDPTDHSQESHQKVAEEILKVCADSVNSIPRDPRRVERVDISELAGTAVNPIAQVAVPSWSPQINFMMKEGKYTCPDCGQGFNGSGNLRRHHKIVHQGVKDFACRFCHKRFAKAQTLKHHEMTHTGEKPHACNLCDARFIQVVALKRHMKVHEKLPNLVPVTVIKAKEELAIQELESLEAKRKAEMEKEAVAEKARKQLEAITRQEEELQRRQREAFENLPKAIPKERLPPGSDITIATNLLPSDLGLFTKCLKTTEDDDSQILEREDPMDGF